MHLCLFYYIKNAVYEGTNFQCVFLCEFVTKFMVRLVSKKKHYTFSYTVKRLLFRALRTDLDDRLLGVGT